ncbi:MAG: extracellular solute-binding protein [Actinobacteria bacterium]|nr:extracellular solute-binding protein [Actinomycetota bacterium]
MVGALAACLAIAGCGERQASFQEGRAATAITFSISVPDEEKPAVQEVVRRFQNRTRAKVNLELVTRFRSQPVSRVDLVTSIDSAELIERLRAGARSGQPTVHLFAQDNLALKPLVDEGLVDDLSEVRIPAQVIPSMVPARFGGRQLFLPFRPNVRVAYADRHQLRAVGAEAPTTIEDLTVVARKLKARTGEPAITLSLAAGDPAAVTVAEWIVSYGGNPLVLNDEGSVLAFENLRQLWQEGLLARESLFAKYDTEVEYLSTKRSWLAQNWSFTSAVLAKEGQLDRFEVYEGWRGPVRAAHVIGGDVLGIPRGISGPERAAALSLATFLMSREAQEVLVNENAWPAIRTDAYGTVPQEQRQTFAAIEDALRHGWFRPVVAYWPDVSQAMNEAVDRVLLQGQPVRPVLDELHAGIEAAAGRAGAEYPPPPASA